MKTNLRFLIAFLCGALGLGAHAQEPHWTCNIYDYQYDMTAYVAFTFEGQPVSDYANFELAALCGDECRGVASFRTVEKDGQTAQYAYLRIRSNQASGETITFMAYDRTLGKEIEFTEQSLTFASQGVEGLPSSPLLLQGTYVIIYYDVTTSVNDPVMGSVAGSGTYQEETEATLTATANTGYHFEKWSNEATANPYTFTVVSDSALQAVFAPTAYSMTFVFGNGEADTLMIQDYATALTAPADPVREGYTFKGWEPAVPATIPAENKTFTAQWEINQYTMTFVLDNGEDDVVKTQDYATALTAPADPVREGYTFKGWEPAVPATIPAENKTFTAQWEINQYTMTFVLDNGDDDVVKTQDYATALTAPAAPVREGYTFKGWEPAVPATIPAEDQTFTAQWEINQYTMTFVLGNGEPNVVKTQNYGTTLTAPADPVREGYTFKGWEPAVPVTIPAKNQTFTAKWQINQYTMTFMAAGEVVATKKQDYGTALTAPDAPAIPGLSFFKWSPDVPATVPALDMTFEALYDSLYADIIKTADGLIIGINADGSAELIDGSKASGEVVIPETVTDGNGQTHTVTAIAAEAFKGNTAITAVTIPATITTIGQQAFGGCTALANIYVKSKEPIDLGNNADNVFDGVDKSQCVLHVPEGSGDKYGQANGWKAFTHIDDPASTAVRTIRGTETAGHWYTLSGQMLTESPVRAGIYLHDGRKVVIK